MSTKPYTREEANAMPDFLVYGADRSGWEWHVGIYHEPLTALWVLEAQRLLHPENAYGIIDNNDPERGDIQTQLEAMLEDSPLYHGIQATQEAAKATQEDPNA